MEAPGGATRAAGRDGTAATPPASTDTCGAGVATIQIPDQATLDKLRERLLETSDAYPHAADIPSVTLTLTD